MEEQVCRERSGDVTTLVLMSHRILQSKSSYTASKISLLFLAHYNSKFSLILACQVP